MLETAPWDLDTRLLEPAKVFADPVHGDIYLNALEVKIVDSEPMQRLRRVRQLGTTHLVYPAATHTRFSHSLGAVRAVQDLLDAVWDQQTRPNCSPGLLQEWRDEKGLVEHFARATVLARLGGLLHDLCHLPFGHSVEDDLELLTPHDENEDRFDDLWALMPGDVKRAIAGELKIELLPLILSKTKSSKAHKSLYPWASDIVGNTICADLIDYLPRDHLYTGLPIALGHRFLEAFYVTSRHSPTNPQRMALMLHRGGHERIDVATELLKYLRYRYELSERALVHHAKLAADAMIGRLLEAYLDCAYESRAVAAWQAADTPTTAVPEGASQIEEAIAWLERDSDREATVAEDSRADLENRMLRHGDDGLIEHLIDFGDSDPSVHAPVVAELARGIQRRALYKLVARATATDVTPHDIYERFGCRAARRRLEQEAAEWAGIEEAWKLVLWLPPASMRLKPAAVLVSDGSSVRKFVDYERPSGRRGDEIYRAHEKLWTIGVYVAPELRDDDRIMYALVWLADKMGIPWDTLRKEFTSPPSRWPEELLRRELSAVWEGDSNVLDEHMKQPLVRRSHRTSFRAELRAHKAALTRSMNKA